MIFGSVLSIAVYFVRVISTPLQAFLKGSIMTLHFLVYPTDLLDMYECSGLTYSDHVKIYTAISANKKLPICSCKLNIFVGRI